jgi:hypothetical protein
MLLKSPSSKAKGGRKCSEQDVALIVLRWPLAASGALRLRRRPPCEATRIPLDSHGPLTLTSFNLARVVGRCNCVLSPPRLGQLVQWLPLLSLLVVQLATAPRDHTLTTPRESLYTSLSRNGPPPGFLFITLPVTLAGHPRFPPSWLQLFSSHRTHRHLARHAATSPRPDS